MYCSFNHRAAALGRLAAVGSLTAALAALGSPAHAQGAAIGKLRITREVLVTQGAAGANATYSAAHDKQAISAGQGVRTLKRAQAELDFNDGSILRVNERTDLIVENTAALHDIHLTDGVVWVRDAHGAHTQVETPSMTAVARGTTFTVQTNADGSTTLEVFDGTVDVMVGGQTITVGPGQELTVASNGATPPVYSAPSAASTIPASQLPVGYGGGVNAWFLTMGEDLGVGVTAGTNAVLDLRTSAIGEALQELGAAGPNVSPGNPYLFDPFQRGQFFNAAQSTLVSDIQSSGLSETQFGSANSNETLAQAGFNSSQISTLNSLGINTVGQAVTALEDNGVNLTVSARNAISAQLRSAYDFNQLKATPNYDYRLLDQNEDSLAFVGIGAALALADDSSKLHFTVPTLSGQAFGFWNDPDLLGGRLDLDGYISDKTHYIWEGNALRLLNGDNVGWYTKADSVAVIEQKVSDDVTLFAGRRRFYDGPVFLDEVGSQLIADRYTSAGATYKSNGMKLEAAYLYDDNPDAVGAQKGGLATANFHAGAGTVGVNYLYVTDLGSGSGITVDGVYPILPNIVEGYAEVGKAPDDHALQTYGGYFPGVYQKTDIDLYIEYGQHDSIGHALSIIANRDIAKTLSVRGYVSYLGHSDTKAGAAAVFKFSTK